MTDVKEPIVPANLFVAIAAAGFKPANNNAGKPINPPPPTTESMKAAKNPKSTRIRSNCRSKSKINVCHPFLLLLP